MQRQNLFADAPWDVENADFRSRIFWRPDDARMGATLYELGPGYDGDRVHMHYGAEEMFFVLGGRIVVRNLEGEEDARSGRLPVLSGGACRPARLQQPARRAGPGPRHERRELSRRRRLSGGGLAWVATRVPELPPGDDPGIIARFDFRPDRPDGRIS